MPSILNPFHRRRVVKQQYPEIRPLQRRKSLPSRINDAEYNITKTVKTTNAMTDHHRHRDDDDDDDALMTKTGRDYLSHSQHRRLRQLQQRQHHDHRQQMDVHGGSQRREGGLGGGAGDDRTSIRDMGIITARPSEVWGHFVET
mmetsp:Transcript_63303/g.74879  ORF Transcript_63303/g.74879 Transcript_63303/m.74879 type:complete len:144 (+) Transcript_63303:105-536(+)